MGLVAHMNNVDKVEAEGPPAGSLLHLAVPPVPWSHSSSPHQATTTVHFGEQYSLVSWSITKLSVSRLRIAWFGSESYSYYLNFDSYPEQNTEPNFGKFRLQLLEQIQSSNSCIFLTFRNLCIRIRLFGKWSIAQCCFYFCLLYMQTSAGFVMNQNISF